MDGVFGRDNLVLLAHLSTSRTRQVQNASTRIRVKVDLFCRRCGPAASTTLRQIRLYWVTPGFTGIRARRHDFVIAPRHIGKSIVNERNQGA